MHASAAPKLRRFVAIKHVIIKMLDGSISTCVDVMEDERLRKLIGRWGSGGWCSPLRTVPADEFLRG